jgi:hypothetical protein
MANSPNARAFDVVTQPIQTQGTEFRSLAKEIADIDTMRSFLNEYRQQYLSRPKGTTSNPPAAATPGPAAQANPNAPQANPNQVASNTPAK